MKMKRVKDIGFLTNFFYGDILEQIHYLVFNDNDNLSLNLCCGYTTPDQPRHCRGWKPPWDGVKQSSTGQEKVFSEN